MPVAQQIEALGRAERAKNTLKPTIGTKIPMERCEGNGSRATQRAGRGDFLRAIGGQPD